MLEQQSILSDPSVASYCGATICIVLSFLGNYAAGIGVIIALTAFLSDLFFKWRRDTREEEEHEDHEKEKDEE